MAFPWIFQDNFQLGTNAGWDSETDTGSALDFPHYSVLAANYTSPSAYPYKGAYCMRAQAGIGTGTADAVVIEGDIDIAANTTRWFRWYMNVLHFEGTANDTFNIFELQSAAGTDTWHTLGMRVTGSNDVVELGVGRSVPTSFVAFAKNQWHCIEVEAFAAVDATSADGTIAAYVDGAFAVRVTGLDQDTAIGRGVLGILDQSSTSTGVILTAEFLMDDARIYPIVNQFPETLLVTQSQHVFVGRGTVENITLISGATATDNEVRLYDTDAGITTDASNVRMILKNVTADEIVDPAGMPVECYRGAFVQLSGTETRALVKISRPAAYSPSSIRHLGLARKADPNEVP